MHVGRLFEIIYLLLQKERVTAKELAERFEVSTRTIYRDIDTISLAGIPIYTEKGKGGGISLLPDFVLSKSMFSEKEQNEILSALHGLSKMHSADSDNVLQKLSAIFNKTATNWLEVDFSEWGYEDEEFWDGLKSAILQRRVVEFDYYSSYSDKVRRRVEPLQLWFKSRSWYLRAFDLVKQDFRVFKLTRMQDLAVSKESFCERDLRSVRHDVPPTVVQRPDVNIRLRISPEMTYRVIDEFSGCIEEQLEDGSHIVSMCWSEDNWVYSTILSFGEYIEVLEPEHIREIIREKAKIVYERYL